MKRIFNLSTFTFLSMCFFFILGTSCKADDPNNPSSTTTVKDIDGNIYHLIKIGNQVWMTENLKTTKYNNGDPINNVIDNTAWNNLGTGAYCNYDNDVSTGNKYGRLYNWYAVKSNKLAPIGWHVPTYADWQLLVSYMHTNLVSGTVAQALASSTDDWVSTTTLGTVGYNVTVNNSSGFSTLPGGFRWGSGTFNKIHSGSYWWSYNSPYEQQYPYWNFTIHNFNSNVGSSNVATYQTGLSVRCIKD